MLAPRPDASSDDGVDLFSSPDHGQIAKNLEICVRVLDGRGHFWNVLISFQRRTPYKKNIGNYQNLKGSIYGFYSLPKIVYS